MHKTLFIYIIVIFSLTACKPPVEAIQVIDKPQCLKSQSRCDIKTNIGIFTLRFNVKEVKVEIPFTMQIAYIGKESIQKINGYMEGKNMFMGKIPLFFKKMLINNQFSAETMLVACTEPNMVWRTWIHVEYKMKNQQKLFKQRFFVDFSSRY